MKKINKKVSPNTSDTKLVSVSKKTARHHSKSKSTRSTSKVTEDIAYERLMALMTLNSTIAHPKEDKVRKKKVNRISNKMNIKSLSPDDFINALDALRKYVDLTVHTKKDLLDLFAEAYVCRFPDTNFTNLYFFSKLPANRDEFIESIVEHFAYFGQLDLEGKYKYGKEIKQ